MKFCKSNWELPNGQQQNKPFVLFIGLPRKGMNCYFLIGLPFKMCFSINLGNIAVSVWFRVAALNGSPC